MPRSMGDSEEDEDFEMDFVDTPQAGGPRGLHVMRDALAGSYQPQQPGASESPQPADRRPGSTWRSAGAAAALAGSYQPQQSPVNNAALTIPDVDEPTSTSTSMNGFAQRPWLRAGASGSLVGTYSGRREQNLAEPPEADLPRARGHWRRAGAAATLISSSTQPPASPASPESLTERQSWAAWHRAGAAASLIGETPEEPARADSSRRARASWHRAGATATLVGTRRGQGPEELVAQSPARSPTSSLWEHAAAGASNSTSAPAGDEAGKIFVAGQRVKLINASGIGEYSGVTVLQVRDTQPRTYLVEVPGLGKRDYIRTEQLVAVKGSEYRLRTSAVETFAVSGFQHSDRSHNLGDIPGNRSNVAFETDSRSTWETGKSSDREVFELHCRQSDGRLDQSAVGAAVRAVRVHSIPESQLEQGLRIGMQSVTQSSDGSLSFEQFVQLLGFLHVSAARNDPSSTDPSRAAKT